MSHKDESPILRRFSAFTLDPEGGNPAGVWIGRELPTIGEMQRIATEIGYSETAFLAATGGAGYTVRYYSPEAEVPFCGHATIASGVLLGEIRGEGRYLVSTSVGEVPLLVERQGDHFRASLTSVTPRQRPVEEKVVHEALAALGWRRQDLSTDLPPVAAYAGAWHLVLAVRSLATLQRLDYDFDRLKKLMLEQDLTTLQLVWRESESLFHSRNPFPVGGVVEDPATGAAAAALGGYLRDSGRLAAPATFTIRQGEAMGRPSLLTVTVPPTGGIVVSGFGVAIPDPTSSGRSA